MEMYFVFMFGSIVGGMCIVLEAKKNGLEKAIVKLFVVACLLIVSFTIAELWLPEKWVYYLLLGNLALLFVITDRLTLFTEKILKRMNIKPFTCDDGNSSSLNDRGKS